MIRTRLMVSLWFRILVIRVCPPCGDSRKYIQIKDLSIYGIGFRASYLGFERKATAGFEPAALEG
jgi:hypothetical protein